MPWRYRIKDWSRFFESAKSKTYKHKSQCYMPNKTGVGYRTLIRMKNGPALFGAWCGMIQMLSRHAHREGYLTDTGLPNGIPLSSHQVSLATDIPEEIIVQMIEAATSEDVNWLQVNNGTDTAGIPDGYCEDTERIPQYPYPSPSPSPLPLPVNPSPSKNKSSSNRKDARVKKGLERGKELSASMRNVPVGYKSERRLNDSRNSQIAELSAALEEGMI